MKHWIIIPFLVAIIISCSSNVSKNSSPLKEFEGIIIYTTILESKSPRISTEAFGDTMTLYIKNDNYRMSFNGNDVKDVYYLSSSNNQYTVRRGINTLFVSSCAIDTYQLVSSEIEGDTEEILNRQCTHLVNNLGRVKNNYWFDPNLYINPNHFKKHKFGYVNVYYEKAHSPWLKYRYEGMAYNLEHTAIKINEMALDDSCFNCLTYRWKNFNPRWREFRKAFQEPLSRRCWSLR